MSRKTQDIAVAEPSQDFADLKLPNPLGSGICVLPKPAVTPRPSINGKQEDQQLASRVKELDKSIDSYLAHLDIDIPDIRYTSYSVYDPQNGQLVYHLRCEATEEPHGTESTTESASRFTRDKYGPNTWERGNSRWIGEFERTGDPDYCNPDLAKLGLPSGLKRREPWRELNNLSAMAQSLQSSERPVPEREDKGGKAEYVSDALSSELRAATVDRNQDGFLDRTELQRAASSSAVRGDTAIEVAILLKHHDALQGLSNDELFFENSGVTENDEAALNAPQNKELLKQIRTDFQRMTAQLHNRPTTLFGTANQASIHAFRQNQLGDCYLLAVAGSLAALRPEAFREMFKQNADGTVRVNFRGGYRGQFDVEAPQDGEVLSYAEVSKEYGFWPQVLEKAVGLYRVSSSVFGGDPHAAVDDGGRPEDVIQLVTGHQTNTNWLLFHSVESIEQSLATAVAERRATVLATSPSSIFSQKNTGLSDSHAFSVVGYDRETGLFTVVDSNKIMELEPTRGDGFIQISAEQIKSYFSESIVETHKDLLWSRLTL